MNRTLQNRRSRPTGDIGQPTQPACRRMLDRACRCSIRSLGRAMRRRDFITLIGSAAHSFFAALAIAFPNSFWDCENDG